MKFYLTTMMGRKCQTNAICMVLLTFTYVSEGSCASINDTNVLLRDVLEGYNKNVRPVKNQKDAVRVNASLSIVSIQELDEIRGIFSVMVILILTWHDANMWWYPEDYGDVDYITTSYKEVWVPELILTNPAEEMDTLGKKWQRVYFDHYGYASWWPGDMIKSTCALDVYNYPFDTQECIIMFGAWGYFPGQMKISAGNDQVDFSYYSESSTWKIAKSKTESFKDAVQIHFYVYLERKPGYVIVNVILPLTFLSLLNAFVFLLSPESGERISYCITVLLSIAVFMTIVSDTLPKTSEPVPVISYKLMFDMAISSLMTLVTILNLRLYNRNDTESVPYWLQYVYRFPSCKRIEAAIGQTEDNDQSLKNERNELEAEIGNWCLRRKESNQMQSGFMTDVHNTRKPSVSILELEEVQCQSIEKRLAKLISEAEEISDEHFQVSWKNISNMIDGIAFIVFTLLSVCSVVVFMVITYKQ